MDRRKFLLTGTASATLALTGCGGGGEAAEEGTLSPLAAPAKKRVKNNVVTTPTAPAPTPTAPAPTPTEPTPTPTGSPAYPFGSRKEAYIAGTKPNQATATMDAVLTRQYDAWKAKRLISAESVVPGGYSVSFSQTAFMCVSEGQGYGMLLAVLFAGHDPDARKIFDGLLAVVRKRYCYGIEPFDPNGKYLMDWRLYADGSSGGEGWNAVDGDLDIAQALLMADKQWGSNTGAWDYLQEAKNTIAGIKSWNMATDGTTQGLRLRHVSRTSDYMIGHFRAFQAATGDTFWTKAIDRAYQLSDMVQTKYSPGVGLMPDFIVYCDTANPIPSPGYMGDGNDMEDKYYWNACRNPWRFASDYLLSGDTRWKTITGRMLDFFNKNFVAAGNDIMSIDCGYTLQGVPVAGGDSGAFIAPVMLGGCIDTKYQALVDAGWNWNVSRMTTGYYDSELQLLSMVVASGNWWTWKA